MSLNDLLHSRDGTRERCPWCDKELATDQDDADVCADAEAEGHSVGGEGDWLCWSEQQCFGCDAESPDEQKRMRDDLRKELAAERADRTRAEADRDRLLALLQRLRANHPTTNGDKWGVAQMASGLETSALWREVDAELDKHKERT